MTPLDAAKIAQAVYSAPPVLGVENSAGRAVTYGSAGEAVAFPGSNNIACWLADLDATIMAVPGFGRLHAGFWEAWLEIRPGVLGLTGVQVTIGHSEGAALALLAAASLCLIGRPVTDVYAFEPPRITTDNVLATIFSDHKVNLHLYHNGSDVVPIVPRLFQSWQHPGPITRIGTRRYLGLVEEFNVQDHLIGNVINSLIQGEVNAIANVSV